MRTTRSYKFRPGDRAKANDKAPGDRRDRYGIVVSRNNRSEYEVLFDGDDVTRFIDLDGLDRATDKSRSVSMFDWRTWKCLWKAAESLP